jgi:dolichol kinase
MKIAVFIIISFVLLASVEVLKRKLIIGHDLSRRLAHIGAGIINLLAPLFVSSLAIISANVLFVGLLLAGRKRNYFSAISTTSRKTYGDIYFPLGIIMSALFLLPDNVIAFQYGVAIMGISDALAGLIGERWGKKKILILNNYKTVMGATTFYGSSLLITLFFFPQISPAVFIIPLVLTAVEFISVYGLDNLILPVISGSLVLILL